MKANFLILISSVAFCLIMTELGMRLCGFHGIGHGLIPVQYSKLYGWELKKNYQHRETFLEWDFDYQTNSFGFKDLERSIEKPAQKKRIVVIGDSFVEGFGVKTADLWTIKLQEMLGPDWEVLNFGVRSYDLFQEYRQFTEIGIKFKPDLVIQSICDNDIIRSDSLEGVSGFFRPKFNIENEDLVFEQDPREPRSVVTKQKRFFSFQQFHFSALVSWINVQFMLHPELEKFIKFKNPANKVSSNAAQQTQDKTDANIYNQLTPAAIKIVFKRMLQLAAKNSFTYTTIWMEDFVVPPYEIIQNSAKELHFPIIVPNLSWKERFIYDAHNNPRGHTVIAKAVFEWMKEQGMVILVAKSLGEK